MLVSTNTLSRNCAAADVVPGSCVVYREFSRDERALAANSTKLDHFTTDQCDHDAQRVTAARSHSPVPALQSDPRPHPNASVCCYEPHVCVAARVSAAATVVPLAPCSLCTGAAANPAHGCLPACANHHRPHRPHPNRRITTPIHNCDARVVWLLRVWWSCRRACGAWYDGHGRRDVAQAQHQTPIKVQARVGHTSPRGWGRGRRWRWH